MTTAEVFDDWAILELMGHRRLAGRVTEVSQFGTAMCRIDIPMANGAMLTQYYGGPSIYCLTPTTEEIARAVAAANQPQPVHLFEARLLGRQQRQAAEDDPNDGPDVEMDEDSGRW